METDRKIGNNGPDLNGIVTDYTMNELAKAIEEVDAIKEMEQVSIDYVTEKVNKANSWICFTSGDDDELYETYRYRVFIRNGIVCIIQGLPFDPEKGEFYGKTN